jgi:hypothetical protein
MRTLSGGTATSLEFGGKTAACSVLIAFSVAFQAVCLV